MEKLNDEYSVRTKVLYGLGGALAHFPDGIRQFNEAGGWNKLRNCVDDVDEGYECQRRVAFFLAHYLAEDGVQSTKEIEENMFMEGFVNIIENENHSNEADLLEKVPERSLRIRLIQMIQVVSMLVTKRIGTSNQVTMTKLKNLLPFLKSRHPDSLDQASWETLENTLKSL